MSPAVAFSSISQLTRFLHRSIPGITVSSAIGLSLVAVFLDVGLIQLFSSIGHPPAVSHIFSYSVALHCAYALYGFIARNNITDASRHYRDHSYLRFLLFSSAMLFLRGGVLALLISDLSVVTPELLLVLALTTATSWVLSIPVFSKSFIFRQKRFGWQYVLSFVVVYTIFLRLLYMGSAELIHEEAYYWNYAQHLDWGYLDHPPGVAVLIKLGTLLFGNTEFGVRIGAMVCWCFTAAFTWGFTRSLFDLRVAHLSLLYTATLPIFFGTSLLMTPDAPLIACWSGALFFFQRALIQQKTYSWLGGGICLGLGLVSKYTIAFLGPALVLFMVIEPRARKYFVSPLPYLSALLALAIFSPVIWWNYHHDWASFLFQSQKRLASSPEFSLHELIASIILLITPVGILALIRSFDSRTYTALSENGKKQTLKQNLLLCLAATVVPLSFFICFSLFREIKLNWTAPIWIAAVPVFALTSLRQRKENDLPWYNTARLWPVMIAFLLLFYGGFLHYFTLGLPGLPFPRESFMIGWRQLGPELEAIVHRREIEHGLRPVVVGMDLYRVASGLAFYRSRYAGENNEERQERIMGETTGRHLFGRDSLMYSRWHQPDSFNRRDFIVASSDVRELDPTVFSSYAGRIGPLESIMINKHGQHVGPLYFRYLEGYTSRQPEVTQK